MSNWTEGAKALKITSGDLLRILCQRFEISPVEVFGIHVVDTPDNGWELLIQLSPSSSPKDP